MSIALASAHRLATERGYKLPNAYESIDEEENSTDEPEEESPPQTLVTLNMFGKDVAISVQCEAVATDGYFIHLVSAIGPASTIKAIAVGLRNPTLARFRCNDTPVKLCNDGVNGQLSGTTDGYDIHRHFLGMNSWHMLAVSKWKKLLMAGDDDTLWQRLRSEDYTTPMIRSWVPEIKKQLLEHGLLLPLECFGCEAYYLRANDKNLDEIVSAGVLSGDLRFE